MKKHIIKFIITVSCLFFLVPALAKAQTYTAYTYDTAGNYKWRVESNLLVNLLDIYPKDGSHIPYGILFVVYSSSNSGVLHQGNKATGDYVIYALNDSKVRESENGAVKDFPKPGTYQGNYYALVDKTNKKVVDIVYRTGGDNGQYVLWLDQNGTQKIGLDPTEPKDTNHWFPDYLRQTLGKIRDSKPAIVSGDPVGPASQNGAAGAAGTTGTTGTTTVSTCEINGLDCGPEPSPPVITPHTEETLSQQLKKSNIATAWAFALDVVNVLAIFILLAIAFANILHLGERGSFSFKRMIPALVIGLIAANFSHLICRAIVDFAAMLMAYFIPPAEAGNVVYQIIIGMFNGWHNIAITLAAGGIAAVVGSLLIPGLGCGLLVLVVVLLALPVIIMIILWFLLYVRTFIIWFLVIVSPIAFFGMFFDPLKKTVMMWWNWFLQWTFMGPIAYFIIYITVGFARNENILPSGAYPCLTQESLNQVGGFTKYLFVNAMLILAVYIPIALGGKLMSGWAGFGKFLGGLGLWAGAGTGAAGLRNLGNITKHEGLQKIQNPLTLPALPRGMENSPVGMLWQKKREADVGNLSTNLKTSLTSGGVVGSLKGYFGGADNMTREDLLKFDHTTWQAEGLVDFMNTGIKNGSRDKMAKGLRGLYLMSMDGRRQEEQKAAKAALDAIKIRSADISDPTNIGKLVEIARGTAGLEVKKRDVNSNAIEFKANGNPKESGKFRELGPNLRPEPEEKEKWERPEQNREPNRPQRAYRETGPYEIPPREGEGEGEMRYL